MKTLSAFRSDGRGTFPFQDSYPAVKQGILGFLWQIAL